MTNPIRSLPTPVASREPARAPTAAQWALRVMAVFTVVVLALALRLRAAERLPIDYDEDDYLRAGQQYATGLQQGDWGVFLRENYRTEHPPLSKIVYGFALAGLPPAPEIPDAPTTANPARTLPQPHLFVARAASGAFNLLAVLALAVLNPLAGLFLAVHTLSIKYTSQVMLEGVPTLSSLLIVLFYLRSEGRDRVWLALSAVAFGLTAAAKYPYCLAAVAVGAHWLWRTYPREGRATLAALARWLGPVAAWAALALAVFFLADPYLWPDPVTRLRESLFYHAGYAQSEAVQRAGFPMWQPLAWLTASALIFGRHGPAFVLSVDPLIALFAIFGLRRAWERQPVMVLWFGLVLGFLLVWSTKWPQYILMLMAPFCLIAAYGFQAVVWEPLARWWAGRAEGRRGERPDWRGGLRAAPWLLPGLIVLAAITLYPLVFQLGVALTDFSNLSIRDGMTGGVWREVREGLTGQAEPVTVSFDRKGLELHWAGPGLLLEVLFSGSTILAFEVIWTLAVVAGQTALGVAVALLLRRAGVRFKGWWQALFILPVAIPEFVGALAWGHLMHPTYGWVSLALGRQLEWNESPEQALLVLATAAIWMGWPLLMLAAGAGLQLIPAEVYDAAAIDGATAWQKFGLITWPMLLPLLAPALIIRAILAFNQFYLFYVFGYLTSGRIPLSTMASESYFVFTPTFGGMFSVSAAINILIVLVLVLFILWFNRWSRAGEGVTYA